MKINYRVTLRSRSTFQNLESTMWLAKLGKGMLFSVEQAFVERDERRAALKMPVWEATEITEQQENFNLFHFQYDWTWQVKITGKTKGWRVNSPNAISLDIVCWLAVISSPVKLQGKCWKDDVVMLTAHLSVKLKFLTRCKQKVVLLQFQHGGQYKSYYFVEKWKCHKISPLTLSFAIVRIHTIGRGLQKNGQRAFAWVLGSLWWLDREREQHGQHFVSV